MPRLADAPGKQAIQSHTMSQADRADDRTALAAEQAFLTRVSSQDSSPLADPRAHALAVQRNAIYADNGFDEQEKAFSAFLKSDKGDPVAATAPWALRVILVCALTCYRSARSS
jgi:hypothetical protein